MTLPLSETTGVRAPQWPACAKVAPYSEFFSSPLSAQAKAHSQARKKHKPHRSKATTATQPHGRRTKPRCIFPRLPPPSDLIYCIGTALPCSASITLPRLGSQLSIAQCRPSTGHPPPSLPPSPDLGGFPLQVCPLCGNACNKRRRGEKYQPFTALLFPSPDLFELISDFTPLANWLAFSGVARAHRHRPRKTPRTGLYVC